MIGHTVTSLIVGVGVDPDAARDAITSLFVNLLESIGFDPVPVVSVGKEIMLIHIQKMFLLKTTW